MSTLMVDATASARLTRQFELVLRKDKGSDVEIEARRFISYLCDRLERNNHALMAASRNRRPDKQFNAEFAARRGEHVNMTCSFLMHDLCARLGRQKTAEYLRDTQTRAGRALAKRIEMRKSTKLNISSVRFSAGNGIDKAREFVAQSAPYIGTGGVQATMRFKGNFPGMLKLGVLIDNEGYRTASFAAARIKLYAKFSKNEEWKATQGDVFAFLDKVPPLETNVMALRGFDCMELLRGVDKQNRDPIAIRVLARVV
ncbi:hypothetical protein OAU50_00740 [Planctomycetota bacterium]|nr:hypothetical protein [Planctomycetota bacterium]